MLQACLNGNRDKSFHAALPCTAEELARDARAVVDAGAQELHVHPRGSSARESLHPDDVGGALDAIPPACRGFRSASRRGVDSTRRPRPAGAHSRLARVA
jgi:uncharacterized protein (DUF849 family)